MYRLIVVPMVLLLFLAGCGRTRYIVLREVPQSPSFVVIPANDYLHEVAFANHIENTIISTGIKVVVRPATKEVLTEQAVGGSGSRRAEGHQSNLGMGAKLTERYFEYESVDADYIVQTYRNSLQVKISKRETREILAVLTHENWPDRDDFDADPWQPSMRQTLSRLGIPTIPR